MKIVKMDNVESGEYCTVTRLGGKHDGLKFTRVRVELDDGTVRHLWISSETRSFYKQVFVPWDFEHPKIVA